MYKKPKSFLWTLAAMVVVASLVLPWVVLADNLVNNLDTTIDPALETVTITAGGSVNVGFYIEATNDDASGCNATGNTPAYLTVSPPSGVTVSWTGYPSPIEFRGCGSTNLRYVTFSSSIPGSYNITGFSMTGGKSGSQWNYETAKFTLIVIPSDTTPPVISYSISGTRGNGDWYVSDVFVDWTVTDPESAVTILEGCVDTTINYDTSGVTLICRAQSAGGTSQSSVTIRRDATPPSVSVTPEREPDHNGWYNKPVAFTVSGTDATSGLAGCAPGGTYTGPDSSSVSFSASCEDYAGNTGIGSYEFQYDATAPEISGSASPAANDYGWNNTDVAVTFTCSDGTSGVASCGPDATLTDEGAEQYVTGSAVDNAGNSASATVGPINIDKTPPTVTASASPEPNTYGWNNTDVTVSFSGVDTLSGIAECDADVVLSGEGAGQSATGSCTDRAGNSASATASGINIDKTPPTISAALDKSPASTGWFNGSTGAPTVSFTCSDNLSGLAGDCPDDYTFGEGKNQSYFRTISDRAGNSASAGVDNIDVDLTPPSISASVTPARPASGWWNIASGAPTVSFTCSDGLSGIASCPAAYTFGEGENQSYSGTAYDEAGNSASAGVSNIDVDLTAPSISASVSPDRPASGWWNIASGKPTVSFTCDDALSGIASCPAAYTFGEGKDQSHSGTAYDKAGNSASVEVSDIDVDLTPPSISASVTPARPGSGWWNIASGAPKVSFTCSDGLSGIDSCPEAYTFGEGKDQSYSGTASDKAGNSASAGVSNIDVDLTPPTITWSNGPQDGASYYYGFVPAAPTCTAADDLSGPNGCTVSGYKNTVGTHTMTATASDKAGNGKTETRTYTVLAWTLYGFYQPVDMGGVWNTVKGGSTVPLKFEIFAGTTELTDTAYVKSFTAVQVSCTGGAGEDEVEFTTTGGTSLRYDPVAGQFIQNWQTPKKPGTCYRVTMTAQDGSSLVAFFRLK